jgi:fibronectin type III domain protein
MAMVRLIGLGGAIIAASGCQSWQIGDVELLPSTAALPATSETEPPTEARVNLSWTAPGTRMDGTSISLSEIDYYEIQYGRSPESLAETQRIDGAATSYHFNDLSPGTWYFTIKVVDTNGLESPVSAMVSKEVGE